MIILVPWAGLEPATSRLGGGRSIHLSYQGGANPSYYKARAERFSERRQESYGNTVPSISAEICFHSLLLLTVYRFAGVLIRTPKEISPMAATIFDGISDPMNQRLISGLAKIGLALKSRAWKNAGSQGLTPTQGAILALLHAKGMGEWRLFSISRALAVSAPTASEAVTALVAQGTGQQRASGD